MTLTYFLVTLVNFWTLVAFLTIVASMCLDAPVAFIILLLCAPCRFLECCTVYNMYGVSRTSLGLPLKIFNYDFDCFDVRSDSAEA